LCKLHPVQRRPALRRSNVTSDNQSKYMRPALFWALTQRVVLIPYSLFWKYATLVLPALLYGSENWTQTVSKRRRIEAAEMKLLRPLAGYILYDHKTNDYIRSELQITDILDKIDEYRRNWLSHLQRMPQNRILLKSYHCRPQGRRAIGKPKKRWRTADYRHTRQDRWIQTELFSTLAKNATKLNPFEIIPLQTTRKENNWKTKETLENCGLQTY